MGGHGGLNILPQKRWNVYNYENREKVRRDEEAAAKEEQLKREQGRKRDAEFRLEKLRQARGLSSQSASSSQATGRGNSISEAKLPEPEPQSESDSKHINLFEGMRIFDPIKVGVEAEDDKRGKFKKMKKEETPRVVTAEDEKYRLGYGIAGKGVKLPWYMARPSTNGDKNSDDDDDDSDDKNQSKAMKKNSGRKTLQELREERLKRERKEKERERALLMERSRRDGGFSSRRR